MQDPAHLLTYLELAGSLHMAWVNEQFLNGTSAQCRLCSAYGYDNNSLMAEIRRCHNITTCKTMYFQSLATDHLINTDHDRLIGSWILIIRNLSAHEYGLETSRHINMDRNKTWQHFNMDHHKLYSS